MAFQRARRISRKECRTRAEVAVRNRQDKQELVDQGRAHGIIVYARGEPIGWCQYGPADELPMVSRGLEHAAAEGTERAWRVTCFVVDRRHRHQGVAGVALRAALDAIGKQGGGVVEAYPIAGWSHGRGASTAAVHVPGVGPVAPAWGSFGNVSTSGTVSMFEQEGFAAVTVLRSTAARVQALGAQGYQVLMRRTI